MRVLARIIAGVLSAYVWVLFSSIFWRLHFQLFWLIGLCGWLISWIGLELITAWRKENPCPRLLTHFRYAPVAIFIFFVGTVVAYDEVKILHSRWTIRQYVHGNASPAASLSLELHNDYRGWCGNGYFAAFYDLYAETAAEGFESPDPATRARSLRASIQVYDWLNGVNGGPFPQLLERASNDPDPLVRRIAAEFRSERFGDQKTVRTFDCNEYKFVETGEGVDIVAGDDVVSSFKLPKESEVKNFVLDSVEKDKAGFVVKANWGGGVYHYEIQFNFRCKRNNFYLYRVTKVSLSTTNPDSGYFLDKKKTKVTRIQPHVPLQKFVMKQYL